LTPSLFPADNSGIVHDRSRNTFTSTALLGAVLLLALGSTGDVYGALLHAHRSTSVARDADGQAMVELLARLTDAARDLHGNTVAPAVPEHCLGEQYAAFVELHPLDDIAAPPRPLAFRPSLTSLPPPLA
jgi:hypothetical protein